MWRSVLLMVVAVGWLSDPALSAMIPGVCTPATSSSGIARPKVSSVFRVNVECSMQEQNRTIYVREYFDYDNNRGRITQYDQLHAGDAFFDYDNNQIVVVDTDTYKCFVGDLATSDDRWMFGYRTSVHGMPHVFGASGALHFGNAKETYRGKTTVRGISVNQWDSCQYSDALNATMTVSWYFSSKTEWDMQLGARSVPIRATAVGKQYKQGRIVPFSHTYDLFRFEEYVYPEDFEIPVGVVCPGRVASKPFPQIPDRFSFTGEVLDYNHATITYLEESYDNIGKVNIFSYKSPDDVHSMLGVDRMLQVNDYNSGIAYVADREAGTCQVGPLGSNGYAFLRYLDNGKVVMKTPAEFFADENTRYSYVGVRTTRNIPCELWVSTTDKIQGYTDRNLTVEWYFAIQEDVEDWNTDATGWRIPVQFRMWEKKEDSVPIWEFNVFYYDSSRPRVVTVDLTSCFPAANRQRVTFAIEGQYKSAVSDNIEMFKYALTSAVSSQAGVSQVRVADIEVYYDASAVLVSFDLLDKPRVTGDVSHVRAENDLATAVSQCQDSIASGSLKMTVGTGANVRTLTPIHSSDVGFGGGALAGLAVAMVAAGSAGGAGAAFFFFR